MDDKNDQNDQTSNLDGVRTGLTKAAEFCANNQGEIALKFNRQALRTAMGAFQRSGDGEALHLALVAFRGVAVCAFATGRYAEGSSALATGLVNASVGLRHWPNAPPLLAEQEQLLNLEKRVGNGGSVCISDDLSSWPFDD
ncbi:hypothetical protein [Pseudoxanthomonas wuyuanensis]